MSNSVGTSVIALQYRVSRLSSNGRSKNVSSGSRPRARATCSTVLPSSARIAGFFAKLTVTRFQMLVNRPGRLVASSRNAARNAGSL